MMLRHLFIAGLLLFQLKTPAQTAHQSLRQGDRAYAKQQYTTAAQQYRQATERDPANRNARYNLACTEYQQAKYAEAEKSFEQVAAGDQIPADKAVALYNLGNARLKQRKYREAIDAYENSLRLLPGDAAAKQNLQMAKQKLEQEQQEEQRKQQQQQDQNAGQQPPQQPSNQPQQDQPNQQPSSSGQEEKPGPAQPDPAPGDAGRMTRQEAQRLLETAVGPEDRKSARKYRATVRKTQPKEKQKDW